MNPLKFNDSINYCAEGTIHEITSSLFQRVCVICTSDKEIMRKAAAVNVELHFENGLKVNEKRCLHGGTLRWSDLN